MNFMILHKNKIIKSTILLLLVIMQIFPGPTFRGASSGLLLWFHNVVPNLLPFIIISNLLIHLNMTHRISRIFHPVLGRLLHISSEGCYPVVFGFLSGIPMGAKSTADLVTERKISGTEGQFLAGLCNNSSPMFILGYIAITQLQLPHIKYALFAVIYASSILGAIVFRYFYERKIKADLKTVRKLDMRRKNMLSPPSPIVRAAAIEPQDIRSRRFTYDMVDSSIMNGFEIVVKIGGYIILFSILAGIMKEIIPGSGLIKACLIGLLEITTGISQICSIDMDISLKIILVTAVTTFGGLSGMAQTKSVLQESGLSIGAYCIAKLISAAIAVMITYVYLNLFFIHS